MGRPRLMPTEIDVRVYDVVDDGGPIADSIHVDFVVRAADTSGAPLMLHVDAANVITRMRQLRTRLFGMLWFAARQDASDRSPPLLRMGRCHRRRWGDVM